MNTNDLRTFQSQPELRAILEARARALAAHDVIDTAIGGEVMIRFRLGDGQYALPARYAREVQPLRAYTPFISTNNTNLSVSTRSMAASLFLL